MQRARFEILQSRFLYFINAAKEKLLPRHGRGGTGRNILKIARITFPILIVGNIICAPHNACAMPKKLDLKGAYLGMSQDGFRELFKIKSKKNEVEKSTSGFYTNYLYSISEYTSLNAKETIRASFTPTSKKLFRLEYQLSLDPKPFDKDDSEIELKGYIEKIAAKYGEPDLLKSKYPIPSFGSMFPMGEYHSVYCWGEPKCYDLTFFQDKGPIGIDGNKQPLAIFAIALLRHKPATQSHASIIGSSSYGLISLYLVDMKLLSEASNETDTIKSQLETKKERELLKQKENTKSKAKSLSF